MEAKHQRPVAQSPKKLIPTTAFGLHGIHLVDVIISTDPTLGSCAARLHSCHFRQWTAPFHLDAQRRSVRENSTYLKGELLQLLRASLWANWSINSFPSGRFDLLRSRWRVTI